MKTCVVALGVAALAIAPLVSIAATPRATASAEKQLWAFSERLALALPGNSRDVLRIVSASPHAVATSAGLEHRTASREIGPSLFASNVVVVTTPDNRTASASFDVTGSCVSMAALRNRYPSLIVMDYARGDNAHATYTFGAQVGDAIVAYAFPAQKLECMSRVAVTPAKVTKRELGIQ
jgi:hypothetical protein